MSSDARPPTATVSDVIVLLRRLDPSASGFQVLSRNTRLLNHIAQGHVSDGEIAVLLRERFLTVDEFVGWRVERFSELVDSGPKLESLHAATDSSGEVKHVPLAKKYMDIIHVADLEPHWEHDRHTWRIRQPAAY